MSFLTIVQAYDLLREAGFSNAAAQDMTAIGLAESGFLTHTSDHLDPQAIGDVRLEDSFWGPSVGMFQERTIKGEYGHNTTRDERWLLSNPLHQCQAAYVTSSHGTNFHPWSTWLHGTAQARLGEVRAALAGHVYGGPSTVGSSIPTIGADMISHASGESKAAQTVRAGVWSTLNCANPQSLLEGPTLVVTGQLYLTIKDLLPGSGIAVRPYTVAVKTVKGKLVSVFEQSWGIEEQNGSTGETFHKFFFTGPIPAGQRLRLQVSVTGQDSAEILSARYIVNYQK